MRWLAIAYPSTLIINEDEALLTIETPHFQGLRSLQLLPNMRFLRTQLI